MAEIDDSTLDRFWGKVDKSDECWEWRGLRNRDGYGRFCFDGGVELAHRFAWMIANGPVPARMFICHRCDNPPCVRPDHLWLGDSDSNPKDMAAKGRGCTGDRNGSRLHPESLRRGDAHQNSKVTEATAEDIRRRCALGESQRSVGLSVGLSQAQVSRIYRRVQRK